MKKESAVRETEDQKLDKLNQKVDELRSNFHNLIMALKENGVKFSFAGSVTSVSSDYGRVNRTATTSAASQPASKRTSGDGKWSDKKGATIGYSPKRKISKDQHEGRFESLEDALVNPTIMSKSLLMSSKKGKGLLERSSTTDE